MGANIQKVSPQTPLPSNKILLIGKGLYQLNHPLLLNNHPSYQTNVVIKVALKDQSYETIPANASIGLIHPSFEFPINTSSFSFQNYNFHIPKLENMSGFTVSVFLNYDSKTGGEALKKQPQHQPQNASPEETGDSEKQGSSYESESSHVEQQKPKQEGYLSSLFSAVSNTIVGNVTSEYLGAGFVDLRQLVQEDSYHNITVPIVAKNNQLTCKLDMSVVKPGLKTEIFEMRSAVIRNQVQPGHIFSRTFEKIVREANDLASLRSTKLKTETQAQIWMNAHVTDRIEVVNIDTTHINSSSGYELITVQVWYRYTKSFIEDTNKWEEERVQAQEKIRKEEESKQQQASESTSASSDSSNSDEQQKSDVETKQQEEKKIEEVDPQQEEQ